MKDCPVSDDEAFDARADWTVRFEEAQKAIENTSWGMGTAKFDRAMRRLSADAAPREKGSANDRRRDQGQPARTF